MSTFRLTIKFLGPMLVSGAFAAPVSMMPATISLVSPPLVMTSGAFSASIAPKPAALSKGGVPDWVGAITTLNKWTEITSASGAGGASMSGTYSGVAVKQSVPEIIIAAAGGHADSADNRVVSCVLNVDAPSWTTRKASDWNGSEFNVAYYASGSPASRHTYWSTIYSPQRDSIVHLYAQAVYGTALYYPKADAFALASNTWGGAGALADVTADGQVIDPSGNIWAFVNTQVYKWANATGTQSLAHDFGGGSTSEFVRFGCWDTLRGKMVSIGFGNGYVANSTLLAWDVAGDGLTRSAITFNSSATYTAWTAATPVYAQMEYDPDNDRYLWFGASSAGGASPKVYIITRGSPNWDIAEMTMASGSATLGVCGSGSHPVGKFKYVSAYKGFIYLDPTTSKLYFMKTA